MASFHLSRCHELYASIYDIVSACLAVFLPEAIPYSDLAMNILGDGDGFRAGQVIR